MKLISNFDDLPLRSKLLILVALAALLALCVGAALVIAYEFSTYRPRATEETREQATSIAATLTAAVEFEDAATATAYLEAFGQQRDVLALAVIKSDGETFAEYVQPATRRLDFSEPRHRRALSAPNDIVVMQPILSSSTHASLWMRKSLRPFSERLLGYATMLAAAALSLLALAVMLSFTIRRTISEPIQALASAARDATEREDYSRRVPSPRGDEVGELARNFNAMLGTIEERERALKRSEQAARRSLLEIEAIYSTAQVGLCVVDREHRFVRINERLAAMCGRSVVKIVGATLEEILPELAAQLTEACGKVFSTGEPVLDVEVNVPTPDSREMRCWIVNHHPLREQSGEIAAVNMAIVDITDRNRVERERANLEAQLRQAQKMEALGTLAGGIAHDFNNVLTAISGNAQLALADLDRDHPAVVSLREIKRGADRAKDLVRRILAFSRPEQNVKHLVDLRPIVDEALRLLRATSPKMLDIRLEAEPDLPVVLADATQVHQILMNLGTNACDAMKDRGGKLTVSLTGVWADANLRALSPDLHSGRYLRMSVADTGTGIDPELMERVFEPFFTTKGPGEGTGLGLSVVHGIMRGHHGAILVRSRPGEGTVFDLYFPAADGPAEGNDLRIDDAAPAGRGEHILYVDDEEALVFLVTRTMERMGYRITGVTRPTEAIDSVRANPRGFDLVISDLGMPEMSGIDLAAKLLAMRPDLPIIITSGYVRAEDARRAAETGVQDIVLKPNTVTEMGQLIRERIDELKRG